MKRLIGEARRLMPEIGIQVPPNLSDWWPELVAAGATDLGGLSANGDHISPEHPFPSPVPGAQASGARRLRAVRAAVRLPRVHRSGVGVAAGHGRDQEPLLVVHPPSRQRAAHRADRGRGRRPAGGGAGARRRRADRGGADGAVRRAAPRGDRGHARGRRRAALPAGRRHRDLRGQSQHQRLQRMRRGLRVLRLRAIQALARCLRALARGVRPARGGGAGRGRHRAVHPVGHPPRLDV